MSFATCDLFDKWNTFFVAAHTKITFRTLQKIHEIAVCKFMGVPKS
jgi:hypothetical protein